MQKLAAITAAALIGLTTAAAASPDFDFGLFLENQLRAHSNQMFGITGPLESSSTKSVNAATAEVDPTSLATVAKSLSIRVVTAAGNAGANIDMIALWPDDVSPTHLIVCNEEGTTQPGVQRVSLADGSVETILAGTTSCDSVRRTPWGTILVGEEASPTSTPSTPGGWLLEIINPLQTSNVLFDRVTGALSGANASNVATRPAVGRLAFEGIALYPSGVMYYGDENRPNIGTAGGAYFKFIPTFPWAGGAPIASLAQSPLTTGTVYGLRLGKRTNSGTPNADYGQGSNTGLGVWIEVVNASNANLRTAAANLKLTGYYRPEDADIDRSALAAGNVRWCGNNTGNESLNHNWGETICVTDGTLAEALANTATPEVQSFVIGTPELAMPDNIAYQPGRGNWVIHEDGDGPEVGRNNDLWICAEDGADADSLSDGCIRIATLNDLNAEWTGGIFDATGTRFFVSVQHNVTGHGVILEITGWR
ncbi:MAG TPA: alkaline phosphatase PhoX [Casimicrobiaceae bacterium]